ncbi:MAG: LysM peptidoglycan-binding domain-containing protein [Gammaproteobacteria bacterium]|nr:LysM peptidoglycan-binding domain-containing protein [Gammaproteobacteria bacterium]
MKTKQFLKIAAIAAVTAGFAAGCTTDSSETMEATTMAEEECVGATSEVKNAIYAAKLKNARARNLGFEWRDTAKIIDSAERAAEECDNARAKTLADKAEQQASDAIAQFHADQEMQQMEETQESMSETASMSMGSYMVVSGDNLWSIAGQDSIYGNPYQWPLIYKANSLQIKDADLIYPGQNFNIPKATSSESAAAIEHAKNRGAWTLGETEASDLDYLSRLE